MGRPTTCRVGVACPALVGGLLRVRFLYSGEVFLERAGKRAGS